MDSNREIYRPERLNEIARMKLHEDRVDDVLDHYAQQVASELDTEIGLVSIVMDEAQKFAGSYGLTGWLKGAKGTPIEWSYCANSVKSREPFIVENAKNHPETKDIPLTHEEGIMCYAGVPLITRNNQVLGNLCVLGTSKTREFTDRDLEVLRKYASKVLDHLESRIS